MAQSCRHNICDYKTIITGVVTAQRNVEGKALLEWEEGG